MRTATKDVVRHREASMNKRLDRLTAILIDAILNTMVDQQAQRSILAAAGVLAKNDVPLPVALRVLTRPWESRRGPTPPPAPCRK
jgi:hypothetical protein